jgi:hypothetical protein
MISQEEKYHNVTLLVYSIVFIEKLRIWTSDKFIDNTKRKESFGNE